MSFRIKSSNKYINPKIQETPAYFDNVGNTSSTKKSTPKTADKPLPNYASSPSMKISPQGQEDFY
jgi:hypothetical protein